MDSGLILTFVSEQRKRIDPANRKAFRELIEERLDIMTSDGGMTESEAKESIVSAGYVDLASRLVSRIAGNERKIFKTTVL